MTNFLKGIFFPQPIAIIFIASKNILVLKTVNFERYYLDQIYYYFYSVPRIEEKMTNKGANFRRDAYP